MLFLWNLCSFPFLALSGKVFSVNVVQTTSKDFEGMGAYNLPPYPDVKASSIMSTGIPCYAIPLEPLFLPIPCPSGKAFSVDVVQPP